MPIILSTLNNKGERLLLIVLGSDNIERIQEKDPFEINCAQLPGPEPVGHIGITYATDTEMVQMTQLMRQGKADQAVAMATAGFKYRPERGDHDLGPERLGST